MKRPENLEFVVIGGGAAGFFGAVIYAAMHPSASVTILEKGAKVLQKVKISGGGRCNVTHACFDPSELTDYYPRGGKELLGPFHHFGPANLIAWFEDRGVALKTEEDGRMFPKSDDSQTIMDCLVGEARRLGVMIRTGQHVTGLIPPEETEGPWTIVLKPGEKIQADKVLLATGSSPRIWELLKELGHRIVPPVPSLFTFQVKDPRITGLAGISVPQAHVSIAGKKLESTGPLLITHWGMSGPAILKLSAWGAIALHECQYRFEISVNWIGTSLSGGVADVLREIRKSQGKKQTGNYCPYSVLPKRLWERLLTASGIDLATRWGDLNNDKLKALETQLTAASFSVTGKSTFKEEFVTAGGVDLQEVNMKNFSSRLYPRLYLAGEVLNIDAVTGGFNFQAAWTGGWLVGND